MDGAADMQAAEQLVAILRVMEGVRSATFCGVTNANLNARRILVKVDAPADDPKGRTVIQVPANWSAEVDSWLACAQSATKKVAAITGEAAIAAAKQQLELRSFNSPLAPSQQSPSAKELEWLASWFDAQPEPDAVTSEQAAAALAERRAARSSSSSSTISAFVVLHEAQLIRAKHHAAELRHRRADAYLARYADQLAELQSEKRQLAELQSGLRARSGSPSTQGGRWQMATP